MYVLLPYIPGQSGSCFEAIHTLSLRDTLPDASSHVLCARVHLVAFRSYHTRSVPFSALKWRDLKTRKPIFITALGLGIFNIE